MNGKYIAKTEQGQGMSLTSLKIVATIIPVVVWEEGGKETVAWRGQGQWATNRNAKSAAMRSANAMKRRLDAYLEAKGERWEIWYEREQKRKRDAKAARRELLNRLTREADHVLMVLDDAVTAWEENSCRCASNKRDFTRAKLKADIARGLAAKIRGE